MSPFLPVIPTKARAAEMNSLPDACRVGTPSRGEGETHVSSSRSEEVDARRASAGQTEECLAATLALVGCRGEGEGIRLRRRPRCHVPKKEQPGHPHPKTQKTLSPALACRPAGGRTLKCPRHTKPHEVVADRGIAPAADRRAEALRAADPRATAQDPARAVAIITILNPLLHIAMHIVQAKPVCRE